MVPQGYWGHKTLILKRGKAITASQFEAKEPSYTSNIIQMHKICKDLQSQISCLNLKVEEERSQGIQIKEEYKARLARITTKFAMESEELKAYYWEESNTVIAKIRSAEAISKRNCTRIFSNQVNCCRSTATMSRPYRPKPMQYQPKMRQK